LSRKSKGRPGGRPLLDDEERLLVVFVLGLLPLEEVAEGGGAGVAARAAARTLTLAAALVALVGLLVAFDFGTAGFFANCLDREADLLLFLVDLDDLELVLVANLEVDLLAGVVDCLGDVAEALDSFGDLDEGSELRGAQCLALEDVADAVLREEGVPDVRLKLLDAERQAAVFGFDAENDRLDLLTLLENFRGVLDALGPREVRDVDEAVDAVFDLDEGAEVGEVADAASMIAPIGYLSSSASQGLSWSCFMPSEMRRSFGLTERMIVSTSSPGLTIFEGCFIRLDQVISETWTRPSIPCSSSTNAP